MMNVLKVMMDNSMEMDDYISNQFLDTYAKMVLLDNIACMYFNKAEKNNTVKFDHINQMRNKYT